MWAAPLPPTDIQPTYLPTTTVRGYSFDLGIEFQYPVLTWGRSEGDIFEW